MLLKSQVNTQKVNLLNSIIIYILLPLFLGTSVYLFLRVDQTFGENLIKWNYQPTLSILNYSWFIILVGSLPDFLWLFALLNLFCFIWEEVEKIPTFFKILLYTLPILSEVFQYFNIIQGTGDYFDILAYLLAIYIFSITNKQKQ